MEYKDWLKDKIEEYSDLLDLSVDTKRYGSAFLYSAKVDVYKECLAELERKDEQDKAVSLNDLEVGKRYRSVFKDGTLSVVFTVLDKGYDSKGRYILYTITSPINTLKGYESEYIAVKYFREVK